MDDFDLRPEPPSWALKAGLPSPHEGETFIPYVQRLGLQPEPLLVELTERTIVLANLRLAHTLKYAMRPAYDRHVDRIAEVHITPQRQEEIRRIAFNIFGESFRRSPVGQVSLLGE